MNKSYRSIKQTISNWGTFYMFNIMETLRNYFTREFLPDSLSSEVAFYFNVSYWRPYFGGKLFEGSVLPASAAQRSV